MFDWGARVRLLCSQSYSLLVLGRQKVLLLASSTPSTTRHERVKSRILAGAELLFYHELGALQSWCTERTGACHCHRGLLEAAAVPSAAMEAGQARAAEVICASSCFNGRFAIFYRTHNWRTR